MIKDQEYYYRMARKKYFNHTLRTLISVMDLRDELVHKHSLKVVRYATKVARKLKLKKEDILIIKIAALLHDLGKYNIDKYILDKPGKLTPFEWEEIKKHPVTSANIVKETGLLEAIVDIVLHHHARFEGGGYPDPDKKGEKIPLGSRIISVADAYDAMTSERPYRKRPLRRQAALNELKRCAGRQFDPVVVEAFCGMYEK